MTAARSINVLWDGVRLLRYRLEGSQVASGGKLILHLRWKGLQPVEEDCPALAQLVDQEGRSLMYTDGSPTSSRGTTDRWKPGVPLASRHPLPVPSYGQPGEYHPTISLHPFAEQTRLPAAGGNGSLVGDRFVLPEIVPVVES